MKKKDLGYRIIMTLGKTIDSYNHRVQKKYLWFWVDVAEFVEYKEAFRFILISLRNKRNKKK